MIKILVNKCFCAAIVVLTLGLSYSYGQPSYPIEIKNGFGSFQFYQGPVKLSMKEVVAYLQPYETAHLKIKKARSTKRVAGLINGTGALFLAGAVNNFNHGDNGWVLAGIGAGFTFLAIPIRNKYHRQATDAIDTYNLQTQKHQSSIWQRTEIELLIKANQVGVSIHF